MQQDTLERLENVVDLLKQGDINITQGDPHHVAYQRRSKSGKMEQIPQKGAKLKEKEELPKERKGKQAAEAVLGGDEHEAFKGMLTSYFNNQKEMRDLTTRINDLKVSSEETMKQIRPLLTKFDNLDKAEDKYRVEFKEGDWDYKFLSFTRETKSYKDLYTKAFNMLNDLQRQEMAKAEEALKTITAQEKFEREKTEKAMRYATLIKTYVGRPFNNEVLLEFNKDLQMLMSLDSVLKAESTPQGGTAGGTVAGRSGVGINKRSEEEDEEDFKKKKKARKNKTSDKEREESSLLREKDDKRDDKDEGKEFTDDDIEAKQKDSKKKNKEEEEDEKKVESDDIEGKDKEGKGATGDEAKPSGKNGKAYEKLATSLENLIALRQRGVKLMNHLFERKDAHGYNDEEKRPKNDKKEIAEKEEKTKSLIEATMPIVALRFAEILEKARSHKYLKRTGAPKHYEYMYQTKHSLKNIAEHHQKMMEDVPEEYTYSKYEIKGVGSGPNVEGWVVQGKKEDKWHDIREFSTEREAEKYQDKLEAGPKTRSQ